MVLYQLLPAALSVLLVASLRLEPLAKLRLLTSGVAVVASMYFVELLLVFLGRQRDEGFFCRSIIRAS